MEKNIINPDFVTDVHMTDKVLSVEQLKKIVEKAEPYIYRKIKKQGFLGSRDYPFITYANFHKSKKCAMSEEIYPAIMKTEEEKNMSAKNLEFMGGYLGENIGREVNLIFCCRNSNECALVDRNKLSEEKIERILEEYFI